MAPQFAGPRKSGARSRDLAKLANGGRRERRPGRPGFLDACRPRLAGPARSASLATFFARPVPMLVTLAAPWALATRRDRRCRRARRDLPTFDGVDRDQRRRGAPLPPGALRAGLPRGERDDGLALARRAGAGLRRLRAPVPARRHHAGGRCAPPRPRSLWSGPDRSLPPLAGLGAALLFLAVSFLQTTQMTFMLPDPELDHSSTRRPARPRPAARLPALLPRWVHLVVGATARRRFSADAARRARAVRRGEPGAREGASVRGEGLFGRGRLAILRWARLARRAPPGPLAAFAAARPSPRRARREASPWPCSRSGSPAGHAPPRTWCRGPLRRAGAVLASLALRWPACATWCAGPRSGRRPSNRRRRRPRRSGARSRSSSCSRSRAGRRWRGW